MVQGFRLLNPVKIPNDWGQSFYSSIKRERLGEFYRLATVATEWIYQNKLESSITIPTMQLMANAYFHHST